jgi:signal transduction histidine kinase/CheY-like chemotaxis protein
MQENSIINLNLSKAGLLKVVEFAFSKRKDEPNILKECGERIILIFEEQIEYLAYGNFLLGSYYRIKNEFELGLNYYSIGLNYCETSNNLELKNRIINGMANCYTSLNDFEKAMVCYKDSLEYNEEIENTEGIMVITNNIAIIYSDLKNFEIALAYYEKCMPYFKLKGDLASYYSICLNLSNCHLKLQNYSEALSYSDLIILESNNVIFLKLLIRAYSIKASASFYLKNIEELNNCEVFFESNNRNDVNLEFKLRFFIVKGLHKFLLKEYDMAIILFEEGFAMVDESIVHGFEIYYLEHLVEVCKKGTFFEKGFTYLNALLEKRLLMFNEENASMMRKLQISSQVNQLQRERELSEQAVINKSNFLSDMSHEIRTPLSSIIMLINEVDTRPLSEDDKQAVSIIRQASQGLNYLLNDILDLSKIEAGKLEFKKENFKLEEEVKKLHQLYSIQARSKNLIFSNYFDSKIPGLLNGDSFRLAQVLGNLLNNSLKFTQKGQISIEVRLSDITEKMAIVKFKITDTGIGISAEKQKSLFQRYIQLGSDTAAKYGGSGLGLNICKQIIELQRGTIDVASNPGGGSIFTVQLPFVIASDEFNNNPEKFYPKVLKFDNKFKCLIVDDSLFNQVVVKRILSTHYPNSIFETTDNGINCLALLEIYYYDFIFLDMQMPGMQGPEVARIIRKSDKVHKNIPIIAFTAGSMQGTKDEAKAAGMNYFLSKPFQKEDLFEIIRQIEEKNERLL